MLFVEGTASMSVNLKTKGFSVSQCLGVETRFS